MTWLPPKTVLESIAAGGVRRQTAIAGRLRIAGGAIAVFADSPLFEAAFANLDRHSPAKANTRNSDQPGPMLRLVE
jgi:hypothetical protein